MECIACGGRRLEDLGPLPEFYVADFHGVPITGTLTPGSMYRCRDCELRFRVPMPSADELTAYYAALSDSDLWQYGQERPIYREVERVLAEVPEHSILDVGCYRGDMLEFLGKSWDRYGVEPCEEARDEAERRGIRIVADSVESLAEDGRRFGAITLIDVMEHLTRPLEAIDKLSRLLVPGGKLVMFTGSTDAWSWKLSGCDYWYCALPEHVAFFSPDWFRWAAPRIGCRVTSIERRAHHPKSLSASLDDTLRNLAYIGALRCDRLPVVGGGLARFPLVQRIRRWRGSWWMSAKDHVLVVLTREAGTGAEKQRDMALTG